MSGGSLPTLLTQKETYRHDQAGVVRFLCKSSEWLVRTVHIDTSH